MSQYPNRGLRHALNSIVPNWLSNRKGLRTGFTILWVIALICDELLQACLEGLRAAFPGKGDPSALPYIGQSRGILQGALEPNDHYATRLRAWLDTWTNAASAEIMGLQIQGFLYGVAPLGANPTIRIVDRSGNWVTINPDGSTTFSFDSTWNWDSISNPERSGYWSDIWIIVYPTIWLTYTTMADPNFRAAWGTYQGFGLGHEVPRSYVDGILRIVSVWKGAHVYVQAIIWSYDSTLFIPGALTNPGNPDGRWGKSYKVVGTSSVASRNNNARYWIPFTVN